MNRKNNNDYSVITRLISTILTAGLFFSLLPMTAIAQTASSLLTISSLIYTDSTFSALSDDDAQITISGQLPEGTTARAYPVTIDAGNVYAAYDITLNPQISIIKY